MSELARSIAGGLTQFSPKQTRIKVAKLDALIDVAAKMQEWPLLEQAVDAKIDEQREFVRWWDRTFGGRHRPPGGAVVAGRGLQDGSLDSESGISKQQVSRWRKALAKTDRYRAQLILAAYRKANLSPADNHRAEGTGENEWFTPAQYIAAARDVMGEIDLDPATHPIAQETIQAAHFYTKADDGLRKPWNGRVWLNPPYAPPLIGQFVEKLVDEYVSGRVKQAILLTHNYTDTAWFHLAAASASRLCFTRGRIRFVDVDGEECSPTQGQAFFYYGPAFAEFSEIFAEFGLAVCRA